MAAGVSSSLQVSLIEIRDSLNELIHSFKEPELIKATEKNEDSKPTRRLTPSELGKYQLLISQPFTN